jgi:hypothetical protein
MAVAATIAVAAAAAAAAVVVVVLEILLASVLELELVLLLGRRADICLRSECNVSLPKRHPRCCPALESPCGTSSRACAA